MAASSRISGPLRSDARKATLLVARFDQGRCDTVMTHCDESRAAPRRQGNCSLVCSNIALDHWTASDGELDLVDLVDEAFETLSAV